MSSITVDIRTAGRRDAVGIAKVHDEAWRLAYAGVIPGMHLERMMQRRGPKWWDDTLSRSRGGIMVLSFGDVVAAYSTIGPARRAPALGFDGEVYELYVKPEFQGMGYGKRLFRAALDRLSANGRRQAVVWSLEDNAPAVWFYQRVGGKPVARDHERFGATVLPKIAFAFGV
jgi:ribosomal protein S18 acetylase RimI-like enzyme